MEITRLFKEIKSLAMFFSIRFRACAPFFVFCLFSLSLFSQSYGDRGWALDTTLLDARFPAMREWAKAGVESGIPSPNESKIVKRIAPTDNLQQAIDEVARTGGVLLLQTGEYVISKMIHLRSGVILRGVSKDSVLLSVKVHGQHQRLSGTPRQSALLLDGVMRVGIENLTLKYTDASFEPLHGANFDTPWNIAVFHKREMRDTTLVVEHIYINNSRNCWVQDCNLLWSGTDPVRITLSENITCRRNFVDLCYNKADEGMGYFNIAASRYVLISNNIMRRIRHLAIQNGSKYNVIIDNDLEVDINFHNGDGGDNLIENNRSKIPVWHSWNPIETGMPSKHLPPGKGNIFFNNHFVDKAGNVVYSNKGVCYQLNNDWSKEIANTFIENLTIRTLYPVK